MPVGSKILSLQTCKGKPCIWAEVDTEKPLEYRVFVTYGTGYEVRDMMNFKNDEAHIFIGTYQLHHGEFVFHVYEISLKNKNKITDSIVQDSTTFEQGK